MKVEDIENGISCLLKSLGSEQELGRMQHIEPISGRQRHGTQGGSDSGGALFKGELDRG
jgi:hypothetical protein